MATGWKPGFLGNRWQPLYEPLRPLWLPGGINYADGSLEPRHGHARGQWGVPLRCRTIGIARRGPARNSLPGKKSARLQGRTAGHYPPPAWATQRIVAAGKLSALDELAGGGIPYRSADHRNVARPCGAGRQRKPCYEEHFDSKAE